MILSLNDGNRIISDFIEGPNPFLISRLGGVESEIINFISKQQKPFLSFKNIKLVKKTWVNAGIWPPTISEITKFGNEYRKALEASDAICVWGEKILQNENSIIKSLDNEIFQLPLRLLDPLQLSSELKDSFVWSQKLENLNVLIVSNLSQSIEIQYKKLPHREIHKHSILPKFNLFTITPPITQGLIFWNGRWNRNLEDFNFKAESFCKKNNIDIALISAGSYGLPIGNFLKSIGVKSIYMGGSLQLMFGVMGQRWSHSQNVLDLRNENWLEKPVEKPPFGFRLIEKKSYW
jgi:hypothetical protein